MGSSPANDGSGGPSGQPHFELLMPAQAGKIQLVITF
jgi:hypothetical protein